jgi:hypothetical protein
MLYLLDRYFTDELEVLPFHIFVANVKICDRIEVKLYSDGPTYLGVYYVDQKPTLRESLIDNLEAYEAKTVENANLIDFLLALASALHPSVNTIS